MSPQGQVLAREHQRAQINNGALAAAMIVELGTEYRAGRLTRDEFVAGIMAQGKLSHDAANRLAAQFILSYRQIEAPDRSHADPLYAEFDGGATFGRAWGTMEDLDALDVEARNYDSEFWRIVESLAIRQHRAALNGGRDTVMLSVGANDTRWRRVTTADPCAFCVMLATRSDYRTRESAMYVVGRARGYGTADYRMSGRISYGGLIAKGKNKGQDRRRGSRPLGEKFHDNCGCSVVEVLGEWEMSPEEQAQYDLYHDAADAVAAEGLPRTAENILAKMREMGEGVIHDAWKPETQTDGAGDGGRSGPPPARPGSAGDRPRDYIPPASDFEMPFDRETRPRATYERSQHILDRHAHNATPREEGQTFYPPDFDEIEAMRELVDRVTYLAEPALERQALVFEAEVDGVYCKAVMRSDGEKWEVRTMWPTRGRGVTIYRQGRKQPLE